MRSILALLPRKKTPPPIEFEYSDPLIRDLVARTPEDHLFLGLGTDRAPCVIDLGSVGNAGFALPAGHGAATTARSLAAQHLAHGGKVLVLSRDTWFTDWCPNHPQLRYASTDTQIRDALMWLRQRLDYRACIPTAGGHIESVPRLLVIVDDPGAVIRTQRQQVTKDSTWPPVSDILGDTMAEGPRERIHVIQFGRRFIARETVDFRVIGPAPVRTWHELAPECARDGRFPRVGARRGAVHVVEPGGDYPVQMMWITAGEASELATRS